MGSKFCFTIFVFKLHYFKLKKYVFDCKCFDTNQNKKGAIYRKFIFIKNKNKTMNKDMHIKYNTLLINNFTYYTRKINAVFIWIMLCNYVYTTNSDDNTMQVQKIGHHGFSDTDLSMNKEVSTNNNLAIQKTNLIKHDKEELFIEQNDLKKRNNTKYKEQYIQKRQYEEYINKKILDEENGLLPLENNEFVYNDNQFANYRNKVVYHIYIEHKSFYISDKDEYLKYLYRKFDKFVLELEKYNQFNGHINKEKTYKISIIFYKHRKTNIICYKLDFGVELHPSGIASDDNLFNKTKHIFIKYIDYFSKYITENHTKRNSNEIESFDLNNDNSHILEKCMDFEKIFEFDFINININSMMLFKYLKDYKNNKYCFIQIQNIIVVYYLHILDEIIDSFDIKYNQIFRQKPSYDTSNNENYIKYRIKIEKIVNFIIFEFKNTDINKFSIYAKALKCFVFLIEFNRNLINNFQINQLIIVEDEDVFYKNRNYILYCLIDKIEKHIEDYLLGEKNINEKIKQFAYKCIYSEKKTNIVKNPSLKRKCNGLAFFVNQFHFKLYICLCNLLTNDNGLNTIENGLMTFFSNYKPEILKYIRENKKILIYYYVRIKTNKYLYVEIESTFNYILVLSNFFSMNANLKSKISIFIIKLEDKLKEYCDYISEQITEESIDNYKKLYALKKYRDIIKLQYKLDKLKFVSQSLPNSCNINLIMQKIVFDLYTIEKNGYVDKEIFNELICNEYLYLLKHILNIYTHYPYIIQDFFIFTANNLFENAYHIFKKLFIFKMKLLQESSFYKLFSFILDFYIQFKKIIETCDRHGKEIVKFFDKKDSAYNDFKYLYSEIINYSILNNIYYTSNIKNIFFDIIRKSREFNWVDEKEYKKNNNITCKRDFNTYTAFYSLDRFSILVDDLKYITESRNKFLFPTDKTKDTTIKSYVNIIKNLSNFPIFYYVHQKKLSKNHKIESIIITLLTSIKPFYYEYLDQIFIYKLNAFDVKNVEIKQKMELSFSNIQIIFEIIDDIFQLNKLEIKSYDFMFKPLSNLLIFFKEVFQEYKYENKFIDLFMQEYMKKTKKSHKIDDMMQNIRMIQICNKLIELHVLSECKIENLKKNCILTGQNDLLYIYKIFLKMDIFSNKFEYQTNLIFVSNEVIQRFCKMGARVLEKYNNNYTYNDFPNEKMHSIFTKRQVEKIKNCYIDKIRYATMISCFIDSFKGKGFLYLAIIEFKFKMTLSKYQSYLICKYANIKIAIELSKRARNSFFK